MRIYSDTLTARDLFETVRMVPGMYLDSIEEIKRAKLRQRGWIVQTAGSSNHWKNSGKNGAGPTYAASYDDHGKWFALLYQRDYEAIIVGAGRYNNADDFHKKTRDKYRPVAV
jgi:hypothetical protein